MSEMKEILDPFFEKVKKDKYVCIDGTTCVGKSSIIGEDDPRYIKINNFMNVDSINFDPASSIRYLIKSLEMLKSHENIVCDRSPVSNIAWLIFEYFFSYHYHLCKKLNENGLFWSVVLNHNLIPLFAKLRQEKLNIIFLIDSDIAMIHDNLKLRGEGNDERYAEFDKYCHFQNFIYSKLAEILNCPCFDVTEIKNKYNIDIRNLLNTYINKSVVGEKIVLNPVFEKEIENSDDEYISNFKNRIAIKQIHHR